MLRRFITMETLSNASAKTEGDWVHIVGVYDETNATIYINGFLLTKTQERRAISPMHWLNKLAETQQVPDTTTTKSPNRASTTAL
jgi:hypothetical protein